MSKIGGYIRDAQTGAVLTNVNVSVFFDAGAEDGTLVPANDPMYVTSTTNPVQTDNVTGYFHWECELSPGPVRISADLGSGKFKIRSGREVMQADEVFISDLPGVGQVMTDGVIGQVAPAFSYTLNLMTFTLNPGAALIDGHLFQTTTTRQKVCAGNTTMVERWDLIILRQHIAGTYAGRQRIELIPGLSNKADPPINTDPANVRDIPLYRVRVTNGMTALTIAGTDDLRPYSYSQQGPNSVGAPMLTAEGTVSSTSAARVLTAPLDAGAGNPVPLTPTWSTLDLGELADVSVATPGGPGVPLIWDGAIWRPAGQLNMTGTAPTASEHAALGAGGAITFPWGNDTAFEMRIHAGTAVTTGDWANIIFNANRASANYAVIFSPLNSSATGLNLYVTARTTDHFQLNTSGTVSAGADYWYSVLVIGDV